jgi:WD40 repeat protein
LLDDHRQAMYLAAVRSDAVNFFDCETMQNVASLPGIGSRDPYRPTICWASDTRMIATMTQYTHTVVVWDISDIRNCQEMCRIVLPEANGFYPMRFTKTSEHLLIGSARKVLLYDVASGRLVSVLKRCIAEIFSIDPVGEGLLATFRNGTLSMWDASFAPCQQGRLQGRIDCSSVAVTEDLAVFAVLGDNLVIVDLATLEPTVAIELANNGYDCSDLQFNSGGNRIIVSHRGLITAHVYDVGTAALLFTFISACTACYSLDDRFIYGIECGVSGEIRFACYDAVTGAGVPCRFPSAAQDAHSPFNYEKLFVFSPTDVILM